MDNKRSIRFHNVGFIIPALAVVLLDYFSQKYKSLECL